MYENLKPICDAINGTAPEGVNDQASALLYAVTGEEATFNIASGGNIPIGSLYLTSGHNMKWTGGSSVTIDTKCTITSYTPQKMSSLLQGIDYLNVSGTQPDTSTAVEPVGLTSGKCPLCQLRLTDQDPSTLESTVTSEVWVVANIDTFSLELWYVDCSRTSDKKYALFSDAKELIDNFNSRCIREVANGDVLYGYTAGHTVFPLPIVFGAGAISNALTFKSIAYTLATYSSESITDSTVSATFPYIIISGSSSRQYYCVYPLSEGNVTLNTGTTQSSAVTLLVYKWYQLPSDE